MIKQAHSTKERTKEGKQSYNPITLAELTVFVAVGGAAFGEQMISFAEVSGEMVALLGVEGFDAGVLFGVPAADAARLLF